MKVNIDGIYSGRIARIEYRLPEIGNDPKTGGSSIFAIYDIQKISYIFHIFRDLNRISMNLQSTDTEFSGKLNQDNSSCCMLSRALIKFAAKKETI